MTHASGSQDQAEEREPAASGWFQPPSPPLAARERSDLGQDAAGEKGTRAGDAAAGVDDQEETAVFPRLLASERPAGASEPAAAERASGTGSAERADDDELPTAIQAPLGGTGTPAILRRDRPADITRP